MVSVACFGVRVSVMFHLMFVHFTTFSSVWVAEWSCDLDHLYKLSFPLAKEAHIKFGFDWPSGFRGEDV